MRWQPGGNLEPVRIICETDWKQCIPAILKYIWMEVVTDVVDCLTTEATLWREGLYTCKIIVFCVICLLLLLLLLRIFYIKRKWIIKTTPPSKYILNSVGCKVDDLELKINILTYKLQYGTWPLPHQIRNPNLKNLRLTLSTSKDRNAWIKHMLLNSTSDTYLSPSKLDSTSVHHMTKLFDTKTGYVSSEIKRDVSSLTNQSDIKLFQTTSVESIKKTNLEGGVHQLGGFSKSENLGESCRVSLLQGKNNDYSLKKMQKHKNPRFAKSRSKIINACDKYTQSIEECKRFLRELKESNKKLELDCSSSAISNDSSSFLESFTDEKSSLHAQTTDARNASRRCEIIGHVKGTIVKVEREENNPETFVDTSNGVLQIDKINNDRLLHSFHLNVHDNSTTNIFSKNDNVVLMSQEETLNQIKDKLESLDNVLRTYGVLNSCMKNMKDSKDKSNDIRTIYQNVVDTLDKMKIQIENIDEIKRNKFYVDFNSKECNDKMLQTTSSDWELFESIDSEKSSTISMKSYSELRLIEDYFNDSIEENNRLKKSNEKSSKIDSKLELYRSNQDLILDQKLILTRSYIQSEENKELLSEYRVPMETDEEPFTTILSTTNSSQLESQSKDSDSENKSTEMLIEEAMQFKKELLSRVELDKLYSNFEIMNKREQTMENNFENVNYTLLEKEKKSLQSKLLDIITEESISSCTDKTSGTYIFLQTKPSNETSIRSSSSLNIEINDKMKDNIIMNENVTSEILLNNLSKQIIPINSSEYFSLNDLSIISKYENISLQELSNDSKSSLVNKNKKQIKNVHSLNGKRQLNEIATWDDDDDMDDDRKRKCHRDEDDKRLISYEELRRTKSFHMSFYKKRNNNIQRNINDILLTKSMKNNVENYTELFTRIRNNDNNEKEEIIVEKDDLLSLNRTTDSSSGGSIKYQLMIDNGSMTNLFSPTETNLESNRCSSSVIKKDEILYDQNLSLKRRPGMLSFAQLKMNTVLSNENDLFQNPYFLAETTLSEITCGETIEFNFIPISVSIDTHESNIFAMTREKIFGDIKDDVSSALRISYNNDRENGKVIEIIENETYESNEREMQIIQKNNQGSIFRISKHATMNIVDHKDDGNDNFQETMILNEWEQLDRIISQHNVISQQSSSYFTGDTSNSINKIDFDSYQESLSNIKMNDSVQEIDIPNDILEFCIDSCIDLLRKKETSKNNNESLELEDVTSSSECIFNNNDANNKTSISYVERNDFQSFDEIKSNMNVLENKSEGFIIDGSIQYKKPYLDESNLNKNSRTSNSNYNSKFKTTNNNIKSKEPINITERMTYSRRYAMNNNNSQLKAKSNSNVIDNKDLQASDSFTKSYTRPNSCNLSEEKSRSKANTYKNDFSSRSAVFSRSNDRSKEEQKNDKIKFKSETHSKCSVLTQKSFSKSCIPILKSRLDARKTEHIYRSKSPMRGPLTMRGLCRDKIHTKDENLSEVNVIPTEGNSINKEETQQHLDNSNKTLFKMGSLSSKEEKVNVIDEDCYNIVPHEQTIIYVNIINHHDRNVTRILDPEKFLEYNTKVEPIAQNVNNESSDAKFQEKVTSPSVIMTQEKNTLPKVVTILSSISNKATDIDSNDPKSLSNLHISSGTLKNFWSFTIQQKEMEVSVKPSVTDTSTSMSDFFKIKEIMMPFNEHRIFGVPKELTNEEYSYLFEILTHKQNLGHLKEIRNLCNRLRVRNTNFE